MRKTLTTLVLSVILAAPAVAYDVNKDIKNLGPAADDLAILLSGAETVTQTFDGYGPGGCLPGHFGSVSNGPSGSNTLIHWQKFSDGVDTKINTGQTIHVGYSTSDHSSHILDAWWTDLQGNRISGSVVFNITSGWTYRTATRRFTLSFRNDFRAAAVPLVIRNIRVAVVTAPFPLAQLNRCNGALAAALQPIASGFSLGPGQERIVELSQNVAPNAAVIAVYDVDGSGNGGFSTDYVQALAVEDATGQ